MLPFVRMLEYGNIKPISKPIKKFANGFMHYVILYENGDLYGIGYNDDRQLKDCQVQYQYNNFILLATNVHDVWCGHKSTLIYMTDGRYIFNGNYNCLGTSATENTLSSQEGDDVTSTFPVHENIKSLSIGLNSTHYIANGNNNVYSRGFNGDGTVGNGSLTRVATFISNTSIQMSSVFAGQYSTIFRGNDTITYGCGKSQYGEMGRSSQSWPSISRLDFTGSHLPFGASYSSTMNYMPTKAYQTAGWQLGGQLANGNTANAIQSSVLTASVQTPAVVQVASRTKSAHSGRSIIYTDDNKFYAAGSAGSTGLPINYAYFVNISYLNDIQIDINKLYIGGGNSISYIFTGFDIYATGAGSSMLPGKATDGSDINIFTKIQLP